MTTPLFGRPAPGDTVRLSVPCTPEHARVARTTAAAFGAMAGFSIDGLDDLRLLVDEVFGAMRSVGVEQVDVHLTPRADGMRVQMASAAPVPVHRPSSDIRAAVLLARVLGGDVVMQLDSDRPRFEATVHDRR